VEKIVTQQLAFSRCQLRALKDSGSPLEEKTCAQAFILQLSLCIKSYLHFLDGGYSFSLAGSSLSGLLLNLPNSKNSDFRLRELNQLALNQESWLSSLAELEGSCTGIRQEQLPSTLPIEKQSKVTGNIIAVSSENNAAEAKGKKPLNWSECDYEYLSKLLEEAGALLQKHRDYSVED